MRRLSAEEKALRDLKTYPQEKLIKLLMNGENELESQVKAYKALCHQN